MANATENVDTTTGELVPVTNENMGDVVSSDAVEATIDRFKNNNVKVMSTLVSDDFATKLRVASAIAAAKPLEEQLGKPLKLQHFILQGVTINDTTQKDENGAIIPKTVATVRAILLMADGSAFYAISSGIISGLENLVGIVGHPANWPSPVTVSVERVKTRAGFYVFNLVPVAEIVTVK